ncbi:MAG: peptidoglycan D,D-transpeptidase FtsI family protein [Endomicrobiia bacterium]
MNKRRFDIIKITIIFFVPLILISRIFYIQIWKHKDLISHIEKQISSKLEINIPRGDILDRNYKLLATSIECSSVFIYSKEFLKYLNNNKSNAKINILTSLCNVSQEEIKKRCEKEKYFRLLEEISLEEADKIKNIPGVEIKNFSKRIYIYDRILNHITGKIDKEGKAYSGVEKEFDNFLSMLKNKEITVYKGAGNKKSSIRLTSINDAIELAEKEKNCSLVLTIDVELQKKIDKILKKYFDIYKPQRIICLVQDPNNGEILSANVLPYTDTPFESPFASILYEPGSTFKVFSLAIFLEENVIKKNTVVDCENGVFEYNKVKIRDVKPHKSLDVEGIIVHSSNIGMAKLYLKYLNPNKFFNYLNLFGFGTLTGVELPFEVRGYVPKVDDKNYSVVTPLMVSFGQGISATLLQIVNGYSMIANGGELLQPYIVKYIIDGNEKIVYKAEKKVIRKILSKTTTDTIKEILFKTVERGSAKGTYLDNIKICAKTGTAQKFDFEINKYSKTEYMMSCCGFFPMQNPQYVVGIFVDEPKKGSLASEVAVPIFKEVVLEILGNYNAIKYAKKN